MKSDKIKKVAEKLMDHFDLGDLHDHPILVEAEKMGDDFVLQSIASALVTIDAAVKNAAENLQAMAEKCEGQLDVEDIDNMAALAEEFSKSDDELLKKQASVLDQILINFGQMSRYVAKEAEDKEVERLREKYRAEQKEEKYDEPRKAHEMEAQADEAKKAIKDQVKTYRPLEAPLNTRTCPDHPGAQMARIADGVYQCSLDHAIFNYKEGYRTMKGNEIPGTDVQNQTQSLGERAVESMSFSTRQEKLNS
jgi:hypothetical protein